MGRTTILRRELRDLPMEDMVTEAVAGDGLSTRAAHLFAGALPTLIIVVVGPAAEQWQEAADAYHKEMGREVTDGTGPTGEAPGQVDPDGRPAD